MDGSKEQDLPHNRMIHKWTQRLTQHTQGLHQLVDMDFYPNQELICNWHRLAKKKNRFSPPWSHSALFCRASFEEWLANTKVTQWYSGSFLFHFALFGLFLSYWSFVVYFGFHFCFVGVSLAPFFLVCWFCWILFVFFQRKKKWSW